MPISCCFIYFHCQPASPHHSVSFLTGPFYSRLHLNNIEICFIVSSYRCSFENSLRRKLVILFRHIIRNNLLRSSWRMITWNRNFKGWVNGGIIISKIKHEHGTHFLGSHQFLDYVRYMGMCVWKKERQREKASFSLCILPSVIIFKKYQTIPNFNLFSSFSRETNPHEQVKNFKTGKIPAAFWLYSIIGAWFIIPDKIEKAWKEETKKKDNREMTSTFWWETVFLMALSPKTIPACPWNRAQHHYSLK